MASRVSYSQSIHIHGVVKDRETSEPIPFAAVQFPGTTTGATTTAAGTFEFHLKSLPADSLLARVIGYQTQTVKINLVHDSLYLDFELPRREYGLNEFVIHAGVNPALIILRKIIQHKPFNNEDRLDNYTYHVYNKLEVDLDHLNKEKFIKSPLFRKFSFVFDNVDSTSEEKPFLPVFLTETLSRYYYQKQPKKTKELIEASKTSGIKNSSFTQFLGTMYENVNIYDNFIPVFDKKFISPISSIATVYYKYHLVDTQYFYGHRCFHITFNARRKGENTFFGDFWVADTSFAIEQMSMQVIKTANINFVNRISLIQEFRPLGDSTWFLVRDKFVADFNPLGQKVIGFIGRKTTAYYDIHYNDTAATNIFSEKKYAANNIYILPGAMDKQNSYWSSHRELELSKNEKSVYQMVDSLQHMKLFRTYSHAAEFLTLGTKDFGPIEIGPYYYWFSENHLEKYRVRFDLGTTPDLFKNIRFGEYLAYGFATHAWMGQANIFWILKRHPRSYLYASYTHDLDNGGLNQGEISLDNIFTLAVRKPGIPQKFLLVDEKRLEYYHEAFSGFSQHWTLTNTHYSPFAPLPGETYFADSGKGVTPLTNTEMTLGLRYAWREKYLEGEYYRIGLGSKYPIVELDGSIGVKNLLDSRYSYEKLRLSISDHLPIAPFGHLSYNLYGGKIWGTLPYMLLEVHPGNELYYYDPYAFNMMNRFEFLSDQWAGFHIEHEFGGGIFDYIPGLRRLKFRQFWTANGVIGSLSPANQALNMGSGYTFRTLKSKPYLELGTGVENILHFLRIDFVWRVAPKPLPSDSRLSRFGIFGSFKLQL